MRSILLLRAMITILPLSLFGSLRDPVLKALGNIAKHESGPATGKSVSGISNTISDSGAKLNSESTDDLARIIIDNLRGLTHRDNS
jgi:hypothetical protein